MEQVTHPKSTEAGTRLSSSQKGEEKNERQKKPSPMARRIKAYPYYAVYGGAGTIFSGLGLGAEIGYGHFGFLVAGGYPILSLFPVPGEGAAKEVEIREVKKQCIAGECPSPIEVENVPTWGFTLGGRIYHRNGDGFYLGTFWGFLEKSSKVEKSREESTWGQNVKTLKTEQAYGPSCVVGWQWRIRKGERKGTRMFIDVGASYSGKHELIPTWGFAFNLGAGGGGTWSKRRRDQ